MNVGGGEAADQLVRMMLTGSETAIRLSGSAAKNMLALTMALAKQNKRLSGKVNMTRMLRETRDLRLFSMTPEQYRSFCRLARKQKLLFSTIRDRDGKGKLFDVVLPVTELDRANLIFERIKYTERPERDGEEQPGEKVQEKEPARDRPWDPELRREAPKKESRSGRGSRDTSSRSSTRNNSADETARTNEKPSIEGRLAGYRAQLDEKRRSVPTVDRSKNRPKAR